MQSITPHLLTTLSSGSRTQQLKQTAVKAFLLLGLGISLQNCQKEDIVKVGDSPEIDLTISPKAAQINDLQRVFAKTLATALQADPALRSFLKEEAAKQFDGDADILYQFVKDKPVAGGATLRERLAHYIEVAKLAEIEHESPLLTIFIPDLPSGFSPTTWNTAVEVPVVSVCLRGSNTVPFYDATGKEETVPKGAVPGFPTLVIKQNERVTTAFVQPATDGAKLEFYRNEGFTFSFIDKNFDNVHSKLPLNNQPSEKGGTGSRVAPEYGSLDSKVITAYYNNGSDPNVQWQRDYIYYGISPTNSSGPLDRNYREVIKTILFSRAALSKMSDQTETGSLKDPALQGSQPVSNPNWWTDGNFELQVSVLINSTNGLGPTHNPINPINPRDIFTVMYRQQGNYYYPTTVLPREYAINMPILPWDLQNYGTGWKFVFVERDDSGTDTRAVQNSSSFGTNFSLDTNFTGFIKGGAKFGTTTSSSKSETHTVVTNLGDDTLGEMILTFDRPVIRDYDIIPSVGPVYITEEINNGPNGYLTASVEPARF